MSRDVARVNVLHLTSDWKFTGPAEPMLIAGDALRARGHRVDLICPPAPAGELGVLDVARERGGDAELHIARGRGIRPLRDRRDAQALKVWMRSREVDVIHVWHSRAHGLAVRARGPATALVRAHSDGLPAQAGLRGRPTEWMWTRGCDALVCTSARCAAAHNKAAHAVLGAVDLERFRPLRDEEERRAARAEIGVRAGAPLIGVVARVQPQRRFDLLFEALGELRASHPGVRLAILGRGTQLDSVAKRPVAELGLAGNVIFAGHRRDDYPELLRSFDALVFLVPGSDGGCRTVLEAAASGVPVVASRRGALPELVVDGSTGYCVDEQPRALVTALDSLLRGAAASRDRFALASRAHAQRCFTPERLAENLEKVYAAALAARAR